MSALCWTAWASRCAWKNSPENVPAVATAPRRAAAAGKDSADYAAERGNMAVDLSYSGSHGATGPLVVLVAATIWVGEVGQEEGWCRSNTQTLTYSTQGRIGRRPRRAGGKEGR